LNPVKEGSNKPRKKRKREKRKITGKQVELKLIWTPVTEEHGSRVNILTLSPFASAGAIDVIEANPVRASAWKEKAINSMTAMATRGFLLNRCFTNEVSSHETFLSTSPTKY